MPKPKKKLTQAQQSKQFVETAKALGVDESGKSFERVISANILVTTKISDSPKKRKS